MKLVEKEDADKFKDNKNQINYVANTLGRIESNLSVVSKNTNDIVSKNCQNNRQNHKHYIHMPV